MGRQLKTDDKKPRPVSRLMNWMDSRGSISDESKEIISNTFTQETQTEDSYTTNDDLFIRYKQLEKENIELHGIIKNLKKHQRESHLNDPIEKSRSFLNESLKQAMQDS